MFDILVKYKEAIANKEDLKLPDEAVQSCISACYFGILWNQVRARIEFIGLAQGNCCNFNFF
jgi:hypothetical protein